MMGEEAVNGSGSPGFCNLTAVTSNAPVAMETEAGTGRRTSVGDATEPCRGQLGNTLGHVWDISSYI